MINIYINDLIKQLKLINYKVIEIYPRSLISNVNSEHLISFTYKNQREYLAQVKSCITYIENLQSSFTSAIFYFSHPFHFVTNHFFFKHADKHKFICIPDGMANYINITTRAFWAKMISKKIVSLFLNISYKMYRGHLTAVCKKIYKSIICIHEKGLYHCGLPSTRLELSMRTKMPPPEKNKLLILGMNYSNYKKYQSNFTNLLKSVRFYIKESCDYYYKFHPNEVKEKEFLKLLHNQDIQVYRTDKQIEFLAADFTHIVAERSSALFNIKILYGDLINCYAFLPEQTGGFKNRYWNRRFAELQKSFESIGVKILN